MTTSVYMLFKKVELSLKSIRQWEKIQLHDVKYEKENIHELQSKIKSRKNMLEAVHEKPALEEAIIKKNKEIETLKEKLLFGGEQLQKDFNKLREEFKLLEIKANETHTPLPNLKVLITDFSTQLSIIEKKLNILLKHIEDTNLSNLKESINQLKELEEIYADDVHKELREINVAKKEIHKEGHKAKYELAGKNGKIYTIKFSKKAAHNLNAKSFFKKEFEEEFAEFIVHAELIKKEGVQNSNQAIRILNKNILDARRSSNNRYLFTMDPNTKIVSIYEAYHTSSKEEYKKTSNLIANRKYSIPVCDRQIDFS